MTNPESWDPFLETLADPMFRDVLFLATSTALLKSVKLTEGVAAHFVGLSKEEFRSLMGSPQTAIESSPAHDGRPLYRGIHLLEWLQRLAREKTKNQEQESA